VSGEYDPLLARRPRLRKARFAARTQAVGPTIEKDYQKRGRAMAKVTEIYPSSYECECGHLSHFFEGTINEMKKMSLNKKVRLSDSEREEHTIVFHEGRAIEVLCPLASNPNEREDGRAPDRPRRR